MSNEPLVWTEQFRVHSYEMDFKQEATVETLCRRFQEAAWGHAEQLGAGFDRLRRENRAWVLSRLVMEIRRIPRWRETVTLHTWPCGGRGAFALRDFEMLDAGGARLLVGTTAWLVLDLRTRKPQRVDKLLAGIEIVEGKRALEVEPEKLPGAAGDGSTTMQTTVRYSDIDVNGHVNNARYVAWILDAYPIEFHRRHAISSLQMNFLGELAAEESISVLSREAASGEYWHSIVNGTAQETCRAKVTWANIDP